MNLDDLENFRQLDPQNMIDHIDGLPDQLDYAWSLGQTQVLPIIDRIQTVIIAGMGGSAIGADLLASYVATQCPVPVIVHRDYDLPAWAHGSHTLVITSSHSGNTEETVSSFERARKNGCSLICISTGGKLAEMAGKVDVPVWLFQHNGMPRAAVGFSFGLLLALFARLGLVTDPSNDLCEAVKVMKQMQVSLKIDVPVIRNPAKRLAGQLVGRWIVVFGSGAMTPVSRRWKGQMNELAKAWAQFDFLPEGDHNTLAGLMVPEALLSQIKALFLRSPSDHPRNRKRADLTREICMTSGLSTDFIDAQGESTLANIWSLLIFGDYTSYYLSMAYGIDPTPIDTLLGFKEAIKE